MAKTHIKPSAIMAPLPAVMVSCGNTADGSQNIITAAWTGICSSDPPRLYVSIMPKRASHAIIKESGEFVVNLVPENLAEAMDFCGCVSKNKTEKFGKRENFTLTPEPAEKLSCVCIKESPVQLECRVFDIVSLGSHDMFLADIVGINIDESVMTPEGRIAMERLGLVSLIHGSYYKAPKARIGRMGFSVMKPAAKKRLGAARRTAQKNRRVQGKENAKK